MMSRPGPGQEPFFRKVVMMTLTGQSLSAPRLERAQGKQALVFLLTLAPWTDLHTIFPGPEGKRMEHSRGSPNGLALGPALQPHLPPASQQDESFLLDQTNMDSVASKNRSVLSHTLGGQRSEIEVLTEPPPLKVLGGPRPSLAYGGITLVSASFFTWPSSLCPHL